MIPKRRGSLRKSSLYAKCRARHWLADKRLTWHCWPDNKTRGPSPSPKTTTQQCPGSFNNTGRTNICSTKEERMNCCVEKRERDGNIQAWKADAVGAGVRSATEHHLQQMSVCVWSLVSVHPWTNWGRGQYLKPGFLTAFWPQRKVLFSPVCVCLQAPELPLRMT